MNVFVTGATGFVGTVVVKELVGAGHQVLGLSRSDASAEVLAAAGATAHRGGLDDLGSLRAGVEAADGVIHLAFIHDFSKFQESTETDRRAIAAMVEAAQGSGKPFLITSGMAAAVPGRLAEESDAPASSEGPAGYRGQTEEIFLAAASRGVRTGVVRLAPTVHGAGDHGFVPMLIRLAREKGVAAYVGDGANRWPAIHRVDAARIYRLALEKGQPGVRWHGVAEEGVPMRTIAEAIGQGLGVPVRSLSETEAGAHFGWMVHFVARDMPASSAATRDALGWEPREPDLLSDLRDTDYFG